MQNKPLWEPDWFLGSLLNNHIDEMVNRYACLRAFRIDLFYQDHTAKFRLHDHHQLEWDNRMLLLFNLAVCYHPRHDVSPEEGLQSIASLLEVAWGAVVPTGRLSEMIACRVERTNPGVFERQLTALRGTAMQMTSPVMTTRSGLTACI